jgi:hypothetical protein
MGDNPLGQLVDDPDYRNLKREERLTYDILVKIGDQKKAFQKLENQYRNKLKEIAQKVLQKESRVRVSPNQAEEMIAELRRRESETNDQLKEKKIEIIEKDLQSSLPDQNPEWIEEIRKKLQSEIDYLHDELEWIQENLSFAKKYRERRPIPQTAPVSPPAEPESKPARSPDAVPLGTKEDTSTGRKGKPPDKEIFKAEKTVLIPQESMGSQPDQIFRSYLQIKDENGWSKFPLTGGTITIGNIRHSENDIKLYDPLVSRLHGVITKDAGTNEYCYIDKDSKNGSYLNGELVEAMEPVTLQNNDELVLGDTKIIVTIAEDS